MARRNLLKKVAPVVMSAAVAFSSMPATAFASDFADSDVAVEEEAEETDLQPEAETDEDDATEVVADEEEQNSVQGIYWTERSISKHILKSLLLGQNAFTYKGCTYSAEIMFAFPMWETYQTHMSYFCNTEYPKTIYIYNQKNISLSDSTDLEAVTAWTWCIKSNDLVPMTVLYSKKQEKYYLNASTYEDYRERYGLPFLRLECIDQGVFSDFNLRAESELKMYGYSVSKADGLTSAQRQSRLAQLMDSGLIPKSKIISHLDLLIKMNYGKEKMEDACYAWKDDRRFVLDYKLHNQRSIWATAFKANS